MRYILTSLIIFTGSVSFAQPPAELIKLEGLTNLMKTRSERIQVFNFWATWCAPCVKELPLLEKLNQDRSDVQVSLVSMDMDLDPNPEKVNKFVARKKLQSRVLILDETNPNAWIDKIDSDWSGALPATLIVNTQTGARVFVESALHEGQLEQLIESVK